MKLLDNFLNRITMYRLVVYVLLAYVGTALLFALTGRYAENPVRMLISLAIILIPAYVTDRGFRHLFKVPTNMETWLITGLILFLIVSPPKTLAAGIALGLAATLSSASKFLLARKGKHFFNPAAFAAAFLSLWGVWPATWWIGSSVFWPFTLVLGLLVVRKIRRFPLYLTFVVVASVVQAIIFIHGGHPLFENMRQAVFASPFIFLSTIMLTEPATMPPRRTLQMVYGAIVAVLYVSAWEFGKFIIYPEVALLIGNLFAYAVSPKFRLRLELKEIQKISDRVYDYVFRPDIAFTFLPGQYMEWTLTGVPYDSRGNRRTFTIASSPTETDVHLGVKYYNRASNYKVKLSNLRPGEVVYASQLSGNFTLNGNEDGKLVFIAGGIGITPFRSMLKYLTDKNIITDAILLYLVSDTKDFAYKEECIEAIRVGVRTVPIVTDPNQSMPGVMTAKLNADLIGHLVPDYKERIFYVSGPNSMVDATRDYLHKLSVPDSRIRTDHFSGY